MLYFSDREKEIQAQTQNSGWCIMVYIALQNSKTCLPQYISNKILFKLPLQKKFTHLMSACGCEAISVLNSYCMKI